VSAATPGQALSPDPADFAYHVRATAFNVLTGKMAGDEWHVPRSERDAIARAVVDAVEPLIRADERALAAQEPVLAVVDLHRWYAVITQPDGTSKVIGHTDDGLGYYDSVDELEAKNS
jgi:hypothetical protein